MDKILKFPSDFLWGSSTSAYQVEGGIENCDWAKDWVAGGWRPAGKACDHYNRYEEDFDLVKKLNQNVHRFSIEWSRIEPEEGKFNQKEIEHYREVISSLRKRDIEPFVGLWHWPIPLWLEAKGGWKSKEIIYYFARYSEKVVSNLKDEVKFWITINEPEGYAICSYFLGLWPPKEKNFLSFLKVIHNLIKAHNKSYKIIKSIQPKAQVGIASNNNYYEAYKNRPISVLFKSIIEKLDHFYFLDRINNYQDFIGLNYYLRNRIKGFKFSNQIKSFKFNQNENKIISDLGWEVYPEGIYYVLKNLKKYKKPIYITENGLADAKDLLRKDFIKDHLYWIYKAIEEGIDVRGYFHWSLMDNFEWHRGFGPRFGLIEIDYQTLERKPRASAFYYARICQENQLILNSEF